MSDLTTAVTGPIDVEAVAVAALLANDELGAYLDELGLDLVDHISTELPADLPLPRLRPWAGGGIPVDAVGRLNRHRLNLDAWAQRGDAGKATANDLINIGLVALQRVAGTELAGAFVTEVRTVTLPLWTPDPGTDLARYYAVTEVYARRASGAGQGSGS